MSLFMTVFKCICMHEYMYVCKHVCIVCVYTCVHASMCICIYVYMYACVHTCMYICIHVCIYVIFKLGFERCRGNCPSWEGKLSGRNCPGGKYPGGKCPGPLSTLIRQRPLRLSSPMIVERK